MKIPKHSSYVDTSPIEDLWKAAALKISMEYGIYVKVVHKFFGDVSDSVDEEICFKVGDHEFGALRDLKRALRNKAFL